MNAQGKRKSLTDDSSPVNSVGKGLCLSAVSILPMVCFI